MPRANTAPWTVKLLELLADGEWHDQEPIFRELIRLVPPGRALRRNENERRLTSKRDERFRQRSREYLVDAGARRIVYESVYHNARVERRMREDAVDYELRLKP